jgi:dCTP diphosphatase
MDFNNLKARLRAFADERDWDQFHSPKNLAMALSVEAAELLEHFQWLTEQQSRELPPDVARQVAEEIADVQIYLVRLADKLGVDIDAAVADKLASNHDKYPADRVRGSAAKYTRYEADTEPDPER